MIFVPDGHGGLREVARTVVPLAPATGGSAWQATKLNLSVPAASTEAVPLDVTHGGERVTSGLRAVVRSGASETRQALETVEGRTFLRMGGRAAGVYHVSVVHASGAVVEAGRFVVT